LPALVAGAGDRASMRFLEFFAANIRNPHTRRAYARAAGEFLAWCEDAGVSCLGNFPTLPPSLAAGLVIAGVRKPAQFRSTAHNM
jgi:hypothetical protein